MKKLLRAHAKEEPAEETPEILEPLYHAAQNSSSLIASPARALPKFLFLGSRGGGTPMRVGLFAGFRSEDQAGPRAISRFLQEIENWPARVQDYALFCYPFVKLSEGQLWKSKAQPGVQQLERDLTRHFLHGMIELHSVEGLDQVQIQVSSRVIAEAVVDPLIEKLGFSRAQVHSRHLSPPPNVKPRPFELRILTPWAAPLDTQVRAMTSFLTAFFAEYRTFACHAADL